MSSNRYLKTVKFILSKNMQDKYNETRENIKEQYESNAKFTNVQNIKIELERVTNNIEINKLPYLSMTMAIISFCFTLIINNALIDVIKDLNPTIRYIIICFYGLLILIVFGLFFINLERKHQCYCIAKSVLEEMLQGK